MREVSRRLWARFWVAVDNEGVVLFQFMFGLVFVLAGIYGILVANQQPPLSLRGAMGHMDLRIWYWLNIIGPLTSLAGKAMRGDLDYSGRWFQLAGDVAVGLMLLAYVTGTVQVESWGKGAYGAFLGGGFCLCAVVMITRDVRRLLRIEKRVR